MREYVTRSRPPHFGLSVCRFDFPSDFGFRVSDFSPVVGRHERGDVRRGAGLAAAEVPGRALAEELREPRLVLDLLVEDGGADGVGARVLPLGELAEVGVAA